MGAGSSHNDENGLALGATRLVAVGCGKFKDISQVSNKILKTVESIIANESIVKDYGIAYEKFRRIYSNLKDCMVNL